MLSRTIEVTVQRHRRIGVGKGRSGGWRRPATPSARNMVASATGCRAGSGALHKRKQQARVRACAQGSNVCVVVRPRMAERCCNAKRQRTALLFGIAVRMERLVRRQRSTAQARPARAVFTQISAAPRNVSVQENKRRTAPRQNNVCLNEHTPSMRSQQMA